MRFMLLASLPAACAQLNSTYLSGCTTPPCRKLLCLHGGGQSRQSFQLALDPLAAELGDTYELVFVSGPYGTDNAPVWIRDPPGGKASPTTDSNWDQQSLELLDGVVQEHGPFYGIVGYSQGTAETVSYLSHAPGSFELVVAFCAYVPTTHKGIAQRVASASPFAVPAFVYMSKNDWIINNCMTNDFASRFSYVTRYTDSEGGHTPAAFEEAADFIKANHQDGSYVYPKATADELPGAACPTSSTDKTEALIYTVAGVGAIGLAYTAVT